MDEQCNGSVHTRSLLSQLLLILYLVLHMDHLPSLVTADIYNVCNFVGTPLSFSALASLCFSAVHVSNKCIYNDFISIHEYAKKKICIVSLKNVLCLSINLLPSLVVLVPKQLRYSNFVNTHSCIFLYFSYFYVFINIHEYTN